MLWRIKMNRQSLFFFILHAKNGIKGQKCGMLIFLTSQQLESQAFSFSQWNTAISPTISGTNVCWWFEKSRLTEVLWLVNHFLGIHNYGPKHLDEAVDFLSKTCNKYPYEELFSPPFKLTDFEAALELSKQQTFYRVCMEPWAHWRLTRVDLHHPYLLIFVTKRSKNSDSI